MLSNRRSKCVIFGWSPKPTIFWGQIMQGGKYTQYAEPVLSGAILLI